MVREWRELVRLVAGWALVSSPFVAVIAVCSWAFGITFTLACLGVFATIALMLLVVGIHLIDRR